jgi:very-short-patch-repair endonuclease
VADAQRGLAHRSQVIRLGISSASIRHRVHAGTLHPVLPSVLAVGRRVLEPLGAEMAALLYAWGDCALSHTTAAALWQLVPTLPDEVAVTLIGRKMRNRPGVRVYRVAMLDARDARMRWGMPVTAPARTLIDLAAVSGDQTVARALNEARVRRLVTDAELAAALERCPLRPGVRRVRWVLRAEQDPAITRSEAERRLRRLVERAQFPRPQFNRRVIGYEVDVVWEDLRVVLEVDGYDFHGHRAAFERDREKDQRLVAAGYTVIRVTWRQIEEERDAVVARIAQALARADARRERRA